MANQIEMRLTFIKSTPGTHVYGSDDSQAATKQIYLSKDSALFAESKPDTITVIVKAGNH